MAFPVVAAQSGYTGDVAGSHNVPLPSGTIAGSKLILFAGEAAQAGVVFSNEHTATQTEVNQGYLVYTPSTSDAVAVILLRVTGAFGLSVVPDETGNSTSPDPPGYNADGDALWCSVVTWSGDSAHTAYSANYTNTQRREQFLDPITNDGVVGVAVCTRNLNTATTEDPGAHTLDTAVYWGALTGVINPGNLELTEPIGLGETCVRSATYVRALADPISLGETCTRSVTRVLALSDPIALGETCSRAATYTRSLSDPIALGETCARAANYVRSLADPIALGETCSRALTYTKSVNDAVALGETCSRTAAYARLLSDTMSLGESCTRSLTIVRALTDGLSLGDTQNRAAAYVRSIADAVALGDTKAAAATITKLLSDAVALGEVVQRSLAITKSVADAMAVGDTSQRAMAIVKAVSDSLGLGDNVATVASGLLTKSVSDAISLGDIKSTVATFIRALADGLVLSDTKTTALAIRQAVADAISLGENRSTALVLLKAVADVISLGDQKSIIGSFARNISDALAVGDSMETALSGFASKSVADAITLGDDQSKTASFVKGLVDAIALGDTKTAVAVLTKSVSDSIALADSRSTLLAITKNVADSLLLSEQRTFAVSKRFADTLYLNDDRKSSKCPCTTGTVDVASDATVISLASLVDLEVGDRIRVEGAGGGGAPLIATIVSISGNDITISPAVIRDTQYPQVRTQTAGHSTTAATSHTLAMPSGVVAGDLLLLMVAMEDTTANTDPPQSTWDSLGSMTNGTLEYHSYKHKYVASEPTSITLNFNEAHNIAWVFVRVDTWSGDLDDVGSNVAVGSSSNPNPPSESLPTVGDKLMFSMVGWRDNFSHTTHSTGYSDNTITSRHAATGGVGVASATKTTLGTVEDPGQHTLSGATWWSAATVYVNNPHVMTATVCKHGCGTGRWFTPDSPCSCCGYCSACEDVVRHYNDTELTLSDLAGAGSPLESADIAAWNCSLPDETQQTWTFPGFAGDSLPISDADCEFGIESLIEVGTGTWGGGLPITGWGGTIVTGLPSIPTCGFQAAIASGIRKGTLAENYRATAGVSVVYTCTHGTPTRTIVASVKYPVHYFQSLTIPDFETLYPGWTWTLTPGALGIAKYTGSYSSGGVDYYYEFALVIYQGMASDYHLIRTYDISLEARSSTVTTVDLSDAPAHYDPYGLLRGVATVT